MPNKKIVYIVIILAFFFLLYACSSQERISDLRRYVTTIKQVEKEKYKKEKAINIDVPKPLIYGADTLPTPFTQTEILPTSATSREGVLNSLQAYPLDVLRFIGTFSQANNIFAYVVAPDGMVYQAKEGDMIGDRGAKVINIQPDRMTVMEPASQGKKMGLQKTVTLELREDQP